MRRVLCAGAVVALAVVGTVVPVEGQVIATNADNAKRSSVYVTPFVSLGSPFSSRVGAAIAFALTQDLSLEAEIGYRHEEMHALSSSVNLLFDLPRLGRVTPYLGAGVGLEQYGTVIAHPYGGLATQHQVGLAVNAGGGIKVPVDENWGIRTDARWSNGIGRYAPEKWRVYNGVTFGAGR